MNFQISNKIIYCFYKKNESLYITRVLTILTRFDIFCLLIFWNLPVYIDQTNKLIYFKRNRLRKQILPILKIFFNPNIEKVLSQFTQIWFLEKQYFKKVTEKLYNYLKQNNDDYQKINYLPLLIQMKVYQEILKKKKKSLNFVIIYILVKYYTKNSKVKNNLFNL